MDGRCIRVIVGIFKTLEFVSYGNNVYVYRKKPEVQLQLQAFSLRENMISSKLVHSSIAT